MGKLIPKIVTVASLILMMGVANAKTFWIDVRTPAEYQEGHVVNAENIPLNINFANDVLQKGYQVSDTLLLYCRSGNRSGQAKKLLEEAGFKNAQNVGGFSALVATGSIKTTTK
ncbi:Thiosulfate sulfurtransferase PspE precursor [Phocoenobacter uteri]|uniref:Thiosulfate sulfurtransferase PspE n=1 Tax=Phocoenobacter uteri TaxID=146806 RepID=A0A379CAJ0_9PAST|nr:rhodanese-like domain-containing protein [Phocoenobacter uteri]MDG6881266.1 hypothetical protein [Phocoenobacter uteri]SUB59291.1 Thiosulfate sulfurtransferase PspE precursor [Phocoenobacter uteri]